METVSSDNSAEPLSVPESPLLDFLWICRVGYEQALIREVSTWVPPEQESGSNSKLFSPGPGRVALSGLSDEIRDCLADTDFVFERQRLIAPSSIPADSLKPCAEFVIKNLFPVIDGSDLPWTLHPFAPEVEESKSLNKRVKNLSSVILQKLKKRFGRMYRRYVPSNEIRIRQPHLIVQLCMDSGSHVYASAHPKTPQIHPYPGGENRMKLDSQSPSRSYLKLAEAVSRMGIKPGKGQKVVDLGAAPGGWSFYMLKQGCRVVAVDRGALKIKKGQGLPGTLIKVDGDGLLFSLEEGEPPYDWLLCDMLCPPRQTLQLLDKWIVNRWMKHFVVNFKLPQKNPIALVEGIQDMMERMAVPGYYIKQLYHDRDEITVSGVLEE